ncbi:hypothetical protein JYK18_36335 [Amycolatopsis sp. 195334CR]|nr:hypothetical protein [Amycolatopsis sp. 195334CR]
MIREEGAVSGNAMVAISAFAISVPFGLWWLQNERRTRTLGDELARAQQELAEAHRREGAVRERDRLSREIHDTLAQGFASIIALAEAARVAPDPEQRVRHLASIETTARENLTEARVLVGSVPAAATGSLPQSLRHTLERFAEDTARCTPSWPRSPPIRTSAARCCAVRRNRWPTSASTPAPRRSRSYSPGARTRSNWRSPTTAAGSWWRTHVASASTACGNGSRNSAATSP